MSGFERVIIESTHGKVSPDGVLTTVEIPVGTFYGDPKLNIKFDLQVWVDSNSKTAAKHEGYYWMAKLLAPRGGGFIRCSSSATNAPEEGYNPEMSFVVQESAKDWRYNVDECVFFKNPDGIYHKLTLDVGSTNSTYLIHSCTNPAGSTKLDPRGRYQKK
jgi:hypothetical protein